MKHLRVLTALAGIVLIPASAGAGWYWSNWRWGGWHTDWYVTSWTAHDGHDAFVRGPATWRLLHGCRGIRAGYVCLPGYFEVSEFADLDTNRRYCRFR